MFEFKIFIKTIHCGPEVFAILQRPVQTEVHLFWRDTRAAELLHETHALLVKRGHNHERAHKLFLLSVGVGQEHLVLEGKQSRAHGLGMQLQLSPHQWVAYGRLQLVLVKAHLVKGYCFERAHHRQTAGVLHVAIVVQANQINIEHPHQLT